MAPDDARITIHEVDNRDKGYERLASYMGLIPQSAIFRRFAALNAKNILYYQAELAYLERLLTDAAEEDRQSGDETRQQYCQWWYGMKQTEQNPSGKSEQWKIFQNIRKTLHDYNEAILQQRELVRMEGPSRQALTQLNVWMRDPQFAQIDLLGEDKQIWASTKPTELLALENRFGDDPFSSCIASFVTTSFHRTIGKYFKKAKTDEHTIYYSWTTISACASIIAVSLSSLLPLLSMVILNKVHGSSARLWVITGFTILFSICLGLVTKARRVEIFSAAAAYAAVQVVFIARNPPNLS